MNLRILVVCLLFSHLLSGQVVVEYAVRIEEEVSLLQRATLPQRVLIATNGNRVVVRGFWETPRNSYQLYVPEEQAFYHCDLESDIAVRYKAEPSGPVWLVPGPTATLAGLACKEAFTVIEADTFPIFYTDAFGVQFCQIALVPGFAMRYTKRLQGIKVTYEAVKYHFEMVPEGMFSLVGKKVFDSDNPADGRQWAMQIGRKAPKIKTACLDGSQLTPKSYADKVLVLDFNSLGWGGFNVNDLNWLDTYAKEYADHPNVMFVSVFREPEDNLRRLLPLLRPGYKVIADGQFYNDAFNIELLPATIVINRYGRIAEYVAGRTPLSEARLRRAIDLALSGGLKPAGLE
ncbi:MAG: hypothetical protein IAE84_15865 [Saprospiraceae bacterium]|nr:hypothetical protein [Saprospiraceae bacterium]